MSQSASIVVETSQATSETASLPDGWHWMRMGDIGDVVNGYGFTEHLQGRTDLPFPFIKVSDMNAAEAETIISKAANTVDEAILKQLRARTYPPGTVIFPKVGGALLTNKKRLLGVEATFDNNVMGIVPKKVDSQFLFYWMLSFDLRTLANVQALPSIRQSDVAALKIPLPSGSEQKRIAAILNEQMAAVEQARAAAEAQLKAAKDLAAAYLREVFDSPEAERWQVQQLGELASPEKYSIKRGPFGGHLKKEIFVSSGYKVYEQGNAIKNDFNIGTYYITQQKYEELEAFKVRTGDVIISCSGTIGKVAVVPDDAKPGIINQALLKVSLNRNLILPKFFKLVFESDHIKKQLKKLSYGSGLENVASVSQLKQVTFPTPDIETQAHIIELYEGKMRSTSQVLKSLQDQLDSINKLPAALLLQAFTGKL